MKGLIKWYSYEKVYGFIQGENSKDVFVHSSAYQWMPKSLRMMK